MNTVRGDVIAQILTPAIREVKYYANKFKKSRASSGLTVKPDDLAPHA